MKKINYNIMISVILIITFSTLLVIENVFLIPLIGAILLYALCLFKELFYSSLAIGAMENKFNKKIEYMEKAILKLNGEIEALRSVNAFRNHLNKSP